VSREPIVGADCHFRVSEMSANRKLQTEIAQVLKKVEEGVALFDDIWEKVYSAGQQSLKEKYEGDLKKEIKKLQRLRDQIKTWLGGNEIKDKGPLTEARKVIETKMEQFKVCEKDTKTKAYSKEGLARDAKMDPKEAAKEEKRDWLNDCLDRLADLIDSIEADIEKIPNKKKSKDQVGDSSRFA
jgi:CCR4-NOT transcription complex subunit 3